MASNHSHTTVAYFVACLVLVSFGTRPIITEAQRVATTTHAKAMPRVTVDVDNVPLATVLSTIARQAGLMPFFDPGIVPTTPVTLHVHDVLAADAFARALRGTKLVANVYPEGNVTIVRGESAVAAGTITGRVTDAKTKQPIRNARVGLDGADRGVETGEDGTFRLTGIAPGTHTIVIRRVGYVKQSRSVTVQDGTSTEMDVGLDPSANVLDQVVVTGVVIPTELKAVPNAISVVTAKDIEARGITRIDQLFRGDVPGIFAQNKGSVGVGGANPFDQVSMFSRGATALQSNSLAPATNPIKTYVDGVELTDPSYVNQIDVHSIERIEILTGPQASTTYGSNAINGVMQIFTKRGTSNTPHLTLNLLSGWVQNNFSHALTPQYDDAAQVSGTEGRLSYNTGGAWTAIGRWTPSRQTSAMGGFGGARLQLRLGSGDISYRVSETKNTSRGAIDQFGIVRSASGLGPIRSAPGVDGPRDAALHGQTIGMTFQYVPVSLWSNEFTLARDANNSEILLTSARLTSPADTALALTQATSAKTSFRATTNMRVSVGSLAMATLTAGGDGWQTLATSLDATPTTLSGSVNGVQSVGRQASHNRGGFFQGQLGIRETLFLTYGIRAEWNPNYGKAAEPNYAPRYGIAYTQELGAITAKLRASYGRSTRPPQAGQSAALRANSSFVPYFGFFDNQLANPTLGPETQKGGEGGLEVYLGSRGSLLITRYNQTVDNLIAAVTIDSVRSFTVDPYSPGCCGGTYVYSGISQNLNLGSVRNQGWEVQGSVNTGPVMTRGTYSWTRSRMLGIAPKYRNLLPFQQYRPGYTFNYLPEHVWEVATTYETSFGTVAASLHGIGAMLRQGADGTLFYEIFTTRLNTNKPVLSLANATAYRWRFPAYRFADLNVTRHVATRVDALLQIQNLTNTYHSDYNVTGAVLGRQSKAGVRIRL